MSESKITKVVVVGAGLIGSSWASFFLAKGLTVVATDPSLQAEAKLKRFVIDAWEELTQLGLAESASKDKLEFTPDLSEAVKNAEFIQENAPEKLELKQNLYQEIEKYAPATSLIASSTSSLLMSDLQNKAKHPERFIIAHPFTPPHLLPLVEIVAGRKTSQATIARAMQFYESLGKHPLHVKKEVVGHIGNRLTSALYKEAVYLVEAGIASVEDVDAAITYGPGMRWAFMGPHLSYHLGGGEGGYRHYLDHLGATQEERWRHHGTPSLTPELKEKLIAGVEVATQGQSMEALRQKRDKGLLALLKLKRDPGED